MAVKLRLARTGAKKRPHYRIVAADSRMPRDGRYIEQVGAYHPLFAKDDERRVRLDLEKTRSWLQRGAQPTDRVQRILEASGLAEATERSNPKKGLPRKKALERAAAAEKAAAASGADAASPAGESASESPGSEA